MDLHSCTFVEAEGAYRRCLCGARIECGPKGASLIYTLLPVPPHELAARGLISVDSTRARRLASYGVRVLVPAGYRPTVTNAEDQARIHGMYVPAWVNELYSMLASKAPAEVAVTLPETDLLARAWRAATSTSNPTEVGAALLTIYQSTESRVALDQYVRAFEPTCSTGDDS